MKWVISRYNHDLDYLLDYTDDAVIYDRSDNGTGYLFLSHPKIEIKYVQNLGTDIYDKFSYIIDNYDNLPDVAVYTKANIFKYISRKEFDKIKDNKVFTPILTQDHKLIKGVSFYKKKMYYEINNRWFLYPHPVMFPERADELYELLGIKDLDYIPFAPGSNYIVPKENILKHPKEFYEKLRAYLDWTIYPGEAQIMERGLYTLWR